MGSYRDRDPRRGNSGGEGVKTQKEKNVISKKGKYLVCKYADIDRFGDLVCLKPAKIGPCHNCRTGKWEKVGSRKKERR